MQPRSLPEFAASIIRTLEALDIVYAVGGSFASSLYGEARWTMDIDIAIRLPLEEAQHFVEAIQRRGYYISLEAIADALIHKQPFNIIDGVSGYKADLYLVEPTPLDESALSRRRRIQYDPITGASAMMHSPEDVIVFKLQYHLIGGSQKHLRDISSILVVLGDELDYDYIGRWAQAIGAADVWKRLLSEPNGRPAEAPPK